VLTHLVYHVYWWGIPIFQFIAAMCVSLPLFLRPLADCFLSIVGSSLTHGNTSFTD